jgi:hypothetical protein
VKKLSSKSQNTRNNRFAKAAENFNRKSAKLVNHSSFWKPFLKVLIAYGKSFITAMAAF